MISERAEILFEQALAMPEDERDAFVAEQCGTNAELRDEVTSLLTSANESQAFFSDLSNRYGLLTVVGDDDAVPASERHIGSWKLTELIGRGGMGAVYRVERDDEHLQQVAALKLLPRAIASDTDIARFLNERQILAQLEHENIARLLDGGVTAEGTPWFAMEYVDGKAIDTHCNRHGLGIDERLRLFLTICEAVNYAHRKLVIHRDIKAENVLVDTNDRVRLLDFGIAKIVQRRTGAELTQRDARPMTPAYASPEMVLGSTVGIATDIYSLGVLLYRLLVDLPPLDLRNLNRDDLLTRVLHDIPLAPSEKLIELAAVDNTAAEEVALARGTTVAALAARLRGDLDTIVNKTLAKEPSARYSTVADLARDIEDFLLGRPVSAQPPTPAYRLRRFVARHRVGVALASLAAVAILAVAAIAVTSAIKSAEQARQIAQERDRSLEISEFLVSVFESADPDQAAGDLTAMQLLEQGRQRIATELENNPRLQADLLKTMSEVYNGMRMSDESLDVLTQELALRKADSGVDTPAYADTLLRLAQITDASGDYDASLEYAQQALGIAKTHGDSSLQAWAHTRVGRVLHLEGDLDAAEPHYRASLGLYESLYGRRHETAAKALEHLANLENHRGNYSEALAMFREILATRQELLGPEHSEIGPVLLGMGSVLTQLERLDDALATYTQAFELNDKIHGPDNRRNMYVLNGLGKVAEARGEYALAADYYADAGRLVEMYFGRHGNLGITRRNLGRAYFLDGQPQRAIPVLEDAIVILEDKIPNHWYLADARWRLGEALLATGEPGLAEPLIIEGLAAIVEKRGEDDVSSQGALAAAAELYRQLEQPELAEGYQARIAAAPVQE